MFNEHGSTVRWYYILPLLRMHSSICTSISSELMSFSYESTDPHKYTPLFCPRKARTRDFPVLSTAVYVINVPREEKACSTYII